MMTTPNHDLSKRWFHLSYWWGEAPRDFKRLTVKLFVGVLCFSMAMYVHAIVNATSVSIMWVVSACLAVSLITVQTYSSYVEAVKQQANAVTMYALGVWQGIWAIFTCVAMIIIVISMGPTWSFIDHILMFVVGGAITLLIILMVMKEKVWAKLVVFITLKVVPQLGQAVLMLLVGLKEIVFPLLFAVISLWVGFLRLRASLQAYQRRTQNPQRGDLKLTEARSNVLSWSADMASFAVMLVCLAVSFVTGGLLV